MEEILDLLQLSSNDLSPVLLRVPAITSSLGKAVHKGQFRGSEVTRAGQNQ